MKVICLIGSKGGVGKSTLVNYIAWVLRTVYKKKVSVCNLDFQNHVQVVNHDDADFLIFDTVGAYAERTTNLLNKLKNDPNATVICPMGTGINDRKEYRFTVDQMMKYGLLDKTTFVMNKARQGSKSLADSRSLLKEMDVKVSVASVSILEDYAQERYTSRTKNEISRVLNEILGRL
ncbi:AAA family ATPase [Vibrio campbellii]|uniref:AAA family ATPase n=1 Tax=Vibrio campbellii TaxID=680 RepID=UPI000CD35E0C|nr:AAA family ATPase [Vibrio campbellii]AUW07361.1 hypothetical protein C1N51_27235 [Vibrio campbellii]